MYNPFTECINENETDNRIISDILAGDSTALEKLVYRHQAWIYNISLKMVLDPHDAEDVTQEILIRIITHISSYDPHKAAFRTWLYRIVANHVLNMKKKKYEAEECKVELMDTFTDSLGDIGDTRYSSRPEYPILEREVKDICLTGLLLCLERDQRLAFILGGMFRLPSSLGAEILEVSEANFRKLLSRARTRLGSFVTEKCSLFNPENQCSCSRHVKKLVAAGMIDPDNPRVSRENLQKISAVALERGRALHEEMNYVYDLFRDEPFFNSPDMALRIRDLLRRDEFMVPELN